MPYDRKLSDHYANFGIHNCGWKVDAYAKAYSEIRPLGYLDFGIQSDFRLLKRLFPHAVLTVILNPGEVIGRSPKDVLGMLKGLGELLEKCRIDLSALDGRTPSKRLPHSLRALLLSGMFPWNRLFLRHTLDKGRADNLVDHAASVTTERKRPKKPSSIKGYRRSITLDFAINVQHERRALISEDSECAGRWPSGNLVSDLDVLRQGV